MTLGPMIIQFTLALVFLAAAASVGFILARQKYRQENAWRLAVLSGEAAKLRRRAAAAEDRAKTAESALTRARRKGRR